MYRPARDGGLVLLEAVGALRPPALVRKGSGCPVSGVEIGRLPLLWRTSSDVMAHRSLMGTFLCAWIDLFGRRIYMAVTRGGTVIVCNETALG